MKTVKIVMAIGALCGLSGAVWAKTHAVDPKLPKEVQPIHCLVGEWSGKATMKMGSDTSELGVTWTCQATSLGYGVACKARFTGMPGGVQEENDLFGFDPGARKYHWFSVTSLGETHDHVAEMPSGNTVQFVYDGVMEGKPLRETIRLTFNDDSTALQINNQGTIGGKAAWSMIGSASKK